MPGGFILSSRIKMCGRRLEGSFLGVIPSEERDFEGGYQRHPVTWCIAQGLDPSCRVLEGNSLPRNTGPADRDN